MGAVAMLPLLRLRGDSQRPVLSAIITTTLAGLDINLSYEQSHDSGDRSVVTM